LILSSLIDWFIYIHIYSYELIQKKIDYKRLRVDIGLRYLLVFTFKQLHYSFLYQSAHIYFLLSLVKKRKDKIEA